jgi:anti-anti-sigma factor
MPDDRRAARSLNFALVSRRAGDSLEVELAGDLDMAATFKLEPELDRLLARAGIHRLVFDLAQVEFIDSTGLGALLAIRQKTKDHGIRLDLVNLSDPVRRMLALSGTQDVLMD